MTNCYDLGVAAIILHPLLLPSNGGDDDNDNDDNDEDDDDDDDNDDEDDNDMVKVKIHLFHNSLVLRDN